MGGKGLLILAALAFSACASSGGDSGDSDTDDGSISGPTATIFVDGGDTDIVQLEEGRDFYVFGVDYEEGCCQLNKLLTIGTGAAEFSWRFGVFLNCPGTC